MAARSGGSSSVPSLPPPCPKSPPEYPDLYGKRRETAKVQMIEREISFLEEELKFVGGLQPASKCCKEVTDFVMAKSDPLIPTSRKNRKSCRFWKWLCGMPCFNLSWICCCCYSGCSCHLKCPRCSDSETVAFFGFLHAQTAVVADGNALVLNVQRYGFAAVVQKTVVTHAAYYSK
ncbi:hypothetical protein REPUB_Repub18cG0119600 [Reevesia pubescens]